MTDKVQKIREEVARIQLYTQSEVLKQVLDYIDKVQKEPVSIDFEHELYKAFGQVKDFTLGMRIAKWFYDMGKNNQEPVSEDLEEAVKNRDEYKEWQGFPDIQKELIDFAKFGNQYKESVSEDLGNYINELSKQFPEVSFAKLSRIAVRVAKWQKEQFEKERLKHCDELTEEQAQMESDFVVQHLKENNRTPTFIDAIEYGMKMQKKQMAANAIDVEVKVDAGGYPYIDKTIELYDYDNDIPLAKEGDKYKVVLIKEE